MRVSTTTAGTTTATGMKVLTLTQSVHEGDRPVFMPVDQIRFEVVNCVLCVCFGVVIHLVTSVRPSVRPSH
jgi:hypothetical protein